MADSVAKVFLDHRMQIFRAVEAAIKQLTRISRGSDGERIDAHEPRARKGPRHGEQHLGP
jgi:hypothetical protein